MTNNIKPRSVERFLKDLFSGGKSLPTYKRLPDEYYKHYWFNKKMCDGVELIAKMKKTSKKAAAQHIMETGFRKIISDLVTEELEAQKAARELNQKVQVTRAILLLRQFAKEHGVDVSMFY